MQKISIAWELIGQVAVGIGMLVGLIQSYKYLRSQSSIAKLEEKVEKNTTNLEKDLKHLERIDTRLDLFEKMLIENEERHNEEIGRVTKSLDMLGSSLTVIINHMIDGSSKERMIAERDKLTDFFIKRE